MLLALAIVGLFLLPDPWRVVFVIVAALAETGELYLWIRYLRRYRITTGPEGMIGESAEVIESCAPDGRVRLRGEIWAARSSSPVERGERVRVDRVEGLVLIVAPERP